MKGTKPLENKISHASHELRDADRVVAEMRRALNAALGVQSRRQRAVDEAQRALVELRFLNGSAR